MKDKSILIPSLFVKNKGEESNKIALMLTKAETKCVVRFTGGCGYMSKNDANNLSNLFESAFIGFSGSILFGGTRIISKLNSNQIINSITEIPPAIRKAYDKSVILGVVPKTSDLQISDKYGLVVSNELNSDYLTIVHPDQDICLVVQESVDGESIWEAEFEECINIIKILRDYADFKSLLISYNGGQTTEKEIIKTAKLGWPILLIQGSGRKTDEYANNKEFLFKYPNVSVAKCDTSSIRKKLIDLNVLQNSNTRKLRSII